MQRVRLARMSGNSGPYEIFSIENNFGAKQE